MYWLFICLLLSIFRSAMNMPLSPAPDTKYFKREVYNHVKRDLRIDSPSTCSYLSTAVQSICRFLWRKTPNISRETCITMSKETYILTLYLPATVYHTAVQSTCRSLQRKARWWRGLTFEVACARQCVAVCCSVLQCVAACCSVLQCDGVGWLLR